MDRMGWGRRGTVRWCLIVDVKVVDSILTRANDFLFIYYLRRVLNLRRAYLTCNASNTGRKYGAKCLNTMFSYIYKK